MNSDKWEVSVLRSLLRLLDRSSSDWPSEVIHAEIVPLWTLGSHIDGEWYSTVPINPKTIGSDVVSDRHSFVTKNPKSIGPEIVSDRPSPALLCYEKNHSSGILDRLRTKFFYSKIFYIGLDIVIETKKTLHQNL